MLPTAMSKPNSSKIKFVREYAINASAKILYPYLSSPGGLSKWFAENVNVESNQVYNFIWDKTDHLATISNQRLNRSIRFVFADENGQFVSDADYVDFTIEASELTGEQFLKITDYTTDQEEEELEELWDNLIQSLREIVGG
jgi:uncharacterized protein YndB with AHSA1/START domain